MIDTLAGRHAAICAAAGTPAEMTVVFDAGQNSAGDFTRLAGSELHYVGSVPASDCGDLHALPASARAVVDEARFGGLTAFGTRREVCGAQRRAILTNSPELHAAQAAGLTGATLAKAVRRLDELAATLARGKNPPAQSQGGSRDRQHPARHPGTPRHHLAADRSHPQRFHGPSARPL
jgi:hypothetical protein